MLSSLSHLGFLMSAAASNVIKMGRPKKVFPESELEELAEVSRCGLNQADTAAYFGYSLNTFKRMMQEDPRVERAMTKGRLSGIVEVAEALYQKALGGHFQSMKFYLACKAGWNDRATYLESCYGDGYTQDKTITVEVIEADGSRSLIENGVKKY